MDPEEGKLYDGQMLRRIARYLNPYKREVGATLFLLGLHSILDAAGPLLTRHAIDNYLTKSPSPEVWQGLTLISTAYAAVILLTLASEFAQTYLMNRTGQKAMFDLRRDLMAHLHRLDISYFDRNPVGRLVTRVTSDVDTLNELFTSGFVAIAGDVVVLVSLLGLLSYLSPPMTLLVVAVMPLMFFATMRFRAEAAGSYRRIRTAVSHINAYLQEHLSGMMIVQLFNREEASKSGFSAVNDEHRAAFKDSIHAYGWFYPAVEFLGMLALAGLLVYGGFAVPSGEATLGTLVAFFQYSMRLFRPIQDLSEKYNILQSATAACERVFQLLDTVPDIQSPADPAAIPADLTIRFENVWFAYNANEWVLRDVSFTIAPGETVAIVGHTGAGKTTLTNLLLRYYDVQKGAIRIGGVDIRQFDLESYRSLIAIVLQDPWLFSGSVFSNISLGTAGVTREKALAAVERVNLAPFVAGLPRGLDEPVAERGANFSTGQKQLISFARALAHEPRILILDEATSSVDTETEIRIRDAQRELVKDRTAIMIAHRLSTIQSATRILAFHKGMLHESGSHSELLAARGLYWKLHQLQFAEGIR